jgi:hypothetical protein
LILVEAIERVVVQLPANIAVTVQLLAVDIGRLKAILVGVVHPLLSFLNKLVQLLSDERREVEVLILYPLVLVFSNGDCLPFHYDARYAQYVYNYFGNTWAYGPSVERVCEPCGAVSPPCSWLHHSLRKGA